MSQIVEIEKARLEIKARKSFKTWTSRFGCHFGISTKMEDIPDRALGFLATGDHKSTEIFYELIISLRDPGHGFSFKKLEPTEKMTVIDIHLFLLDRARFEFMKRLGWLSEYSGEEYTIVELITDFCDLAPDIQARPPVLSKSHPRYNEYESKNLFEKEVIIRKLIPEALNILSL